MLVSNINISCFPESHTQSNRPNVAEMGELKSWLASEFSVYDRRMEIDTQELVLRRCYCSSYLEMAGQKVCSFHTLDSGALRNRG